MFELNISCPNVKEGGIGFGTDPKLAYEVTKAVREVTTKPLIVKLSPNVTDIVAIAKAVESAGADAISLINTLLGMRIDIERGRMILANKTGGFSGPAIKPVAIRMVYQVSRAVNVPIIGLGGISSAEDVIEFIMAGADAVAIGSAALMNPTAPKEILEDLEKYMIEHGYNSIEDIKKAFKD
jgi:dihydroorotate dehydrogenase (NAD+) catalytic subunit